VSFGSFGVREGDLSLGSGVGVLSKFGGGLGVSACPFDWGRLRAPPIQTTPTIRRRQATAIPPASTTRKRAGDSPNLTRLRVGSGTSVAVSVELLGRGRGVDWSGAEAEVGGMDSGASVKPRSGASALVFTSEGAGAEDIDSAASVQPRSGAAGR